MDIREKKVEKILSEIAMLVKKTEYMLFPLKVKECGYKKDNVLPPVDDTWSDYNDGDKFSGLDKHFWLYKKFKTPKARENTEFRFSLDSGVNPKSYNGSARNPQCILYVNGKIEQGLDLNHLEYELEPETEYEFYIYLYTGMFYGYDYDLKCEIKSVNKIIEKLYYDMKVPFDAALLFDEKDYEHIETLKHLDIATKKLDLRNGASPEFEKTAVLASEYLKENYYGKYQGFDITVDAVGHTHIDVAWMWTYAQTREKVQRSFSTVLKLMEKYPEYKFTISQPQLLQYLKEEAPELYENLKTRVFEGRIEIEGAMWIEPDCNLSSGESLVRQLIKGKKFIKDEFDCDSKLLWLPDVFGYSAALPQILKKSGITKFATSKISWNEYNVLPNDIFTWRGIDGSEIMTYFLVGHRHTSKARGTSYCAEIDPDTILGTWERFQQKEYSDETFVVYGYGDGGGGPTAEMLETRRRIDAGIMGIPKCPTKNITESLNSIEEKFLQNVKDLNKMPKWVGELYLEFHRGTYTAIGKVKRYNRKTEFMCQNTEKLAVLNKVLFGKTYPKAELDKAWHNVLLNQFHDVVPGSSVQMVYEDEVFPMYEESIKILNSLSEENQNDICVKINAEGKIIVYNPNAFPCKDEVLYNGEYIKTGIIPALGWKVIEKDVKCEVSLSDAKISNKYFDILFDDNYDIISIYDKVNNREVIKPGMKANEFRMYEDLPYSYDAWELSEYHREKMWTMDEVISVDKIHKGSAKGFLIKKRFNKSFVTQEILMYSDIDRIDFNTKLSWHEHHVIMKTAFPVDVNTNKATYDIQFGNIERTHNQNTSWDVAKFETCAHKYVDIADNGYGLALLNDCKYGYSVVDDNTLQLTLIRGSNDSSDTTINDQGEHEFSYSVIPHKGDFKEGGIVKKSYVFNNPPCVFEGICGTGELENEFSFVNVDKENIIIETIKESEDGKSIIVRLYDAYNARENVNISFGMDIKKAYICDLMENNERELEVKNNRVNITVDSFEIITLKLI